MSYLFGNYWLFFCVWCDTLSGMTDFYM